MSSPNLTSPDQGGLPAPSVDASLTAKAEAPATKGVRLLILSDIHLEFATFFPPDQALYDIAVLAGDIWNGPRTVRWAKRDTTFGGKPVVLVPGNHEFYGTERNRTLELMRQEAAGSTVHLLDRDEVVLSGIRFLGTTLWTDFALDVTRGVDVALAMFHAVRGLNDFSGLIRERRPDGNSTTVFKPQDAAREHAESREWLRERLSAAATEATPTVVVTHHGPSSRSQDPSYLGSRLNPCFHSELPPSFFQTAELWVHGHTHSSCDYVHHRTRVIANPRGYVRWSGSPENSAFQEDLVVTLDTGGGHV